MVLSFVYQSFYSKVVESSHQPVVTLLHSCKLGWNAGTGVPKFRGMIGLELIRVVIRDTGSLLGRLNWWGFLRTLDAPMIGLVTQV